MAATNGMIGGFADEAPDLIDPIIGFRSWRVTDPECPRLISTAVPLEWTPAISAECTPPTYFVDDAIKTPHASPHPDCSCGLYAFLEPGRMGGGLVIGAVALWGRIEVHETGMRAEHARVIALSKSDAAMRILGKDGMAQLARHYSVPLVGPADLKSVALEHGLPVPAAFTKAAREKTEAKREEMRKTVEARQSGRRPSTDAPLTALTFARWPWGK